MVLSRSSPGADGFRIGSRQGPICRPRCPSGSWRRPKAALGAAVPRLISLTIDSRREPKMGAVFEALQRQVSSTRAPWRPPASGPPAASAVRLPRPTARRGATPTAPPSNGAAGTSQADRYPGRRTADVLVCAGCGSGGGVEDVACCGAVSIGATRSCPSLRASATNAAPTSWASAGDEKSLLVHRAAVSVPDRARAGQSAHNALT